MKWTFEVRSVEFELNDGMGRSDELEAAERRAAAAWVDRAGSAGSAGSGPRRIVVEAEDVADALRALARSIERDTGWDVRRVDAEPVLDPAGP